MTEQLKATDTHPTDALSIANELLEPVDGFPEPTRLEVMAAENLRAQHRQIQILECALRGADTEVLKQRNDYEALLRESDELRAKLAAYACREPIGEVQLIQTGVHDEAQVRFHMYDSIPELGTKLYAAPKVPT